MPVAYYDSDRQRATWTCLARLALVTPPCRNLMLLIIIVGNRLSKVRRKCCNRGQSLCIGSRTRQCVRRAPGLMLRVHLFCVRATRLRVVNVQTPLTVIAVRGRDGNPSWKLLSRCRGVIGGVMSLLLIPVRHLLVLWARRPRARSDR